MSNDKNGNNVSGSHDSDHSGQCCRSGHAADSVNIENLLRELSIRNQHGQPQYSAANTSPVRRPGPPGVIGGPIATQVNTSNRVGLSDQQETLPINLSHSGPLSVPPSDQHVPVPSNSVPSPVLQQQQLNHDQAGSRKRGDDAGGRGPGAVSIQHSLERAVYNYRCAANGSEPRYKWCGTLPERVYTAPIYSKKVFLGGIPWDMTEAGLMQTFCVYGAVRVEWPGKVSRLRGAGRAKIPGGFAYLLFDSEKSVRLLLHCCKRVLGHVGCYLYAVRSRRVRAKDVQVIPWVICDSNYVSVSAGRPDATKTVHVGALHGMVTAEGLGRVMADLFGTVVYAGIDTDCDKYPIGSGHVTFASLASFREAVNAAFVELKTPRFVKKIQIDPYLEEAPCSQCVMVNGAFFCRDLWCFQYFCRECWYRYHSDKSLLHHKPLMKSITDVLCVSSGGSTGGGDGRARDPTKVTAHAGPPAAPPWVRPSPTMGTRPGRPGRPVSHAPPAGTPVRSCRQGLNVRAPMGSTTRSLNRK